MTAAGNDTVELGNLPLTSFTNSASNARVRLRFAYRMVVVECFEPFVDDEELGLELGVGHEIMRINDEECGVVTAGC